MKRVNLKASDSGTISPGDPRMQPGPNRTRAGGRVVSATISIVDVPDDTSVAAVLARVNSTGFVSPLDGPYEISFSDLTPGRIIRAPKKQTTNTNLRLAESTHADMVRLAASNGRSLNTEIEQACRQHLIISAKRK
jgi:hypothetical protein